jgi:hypothetical protein
MRRLFRRRQADQRARLAADARRLAGFADSTLATPDASAPRCPKASLPAPWSGTTGRGGWPNGPPKMPDLESDYFLLFVALLVVGLVLAGVLARGLT